MNSDFSEYCVKIYLGAWLFWELLTVGWSLVPPLVPALVHTSICVPGNEPRAGETK